MSEDVTIKTWCHACGDVELTPQEVRLVADAFEEWFYYEFVCDMCRSEVRWSTSRDFASQLKAVGVAAESWNVPPEALEKHSGPPLSYDDVLDFALWLKRVNLLAAAAATRGPRHRASAPETAT